MQYYIHVLVCNFIVLHKASFNCVLCQVALKDPVIMQKIHIYETFNGGAVTSVEGMGTDKKWKSLYKTDKTEVLTKERVLEIPVKVRVGPKQSVRICFRQRSPISTLLLCVVIKPSYGFG